MWMSKKNPRRRESYLMKMERMWRNNEDKYSRTFKKNFTHQLKDRDSKSGF